MTFRFGLIQLRPFSHISTVPPKSSNGRSNIEFKGKCYFSMTKSLQKNIAVKKVRLTIIKSLQVLSINFDV